MRPREIGRCRERRVYDRRLSKAVAKLTNKIVPTYFTDVALHVEHMEPIAIASFPELLYAVAQ